MEKTKEQNLKQNAMIILKQVQKIYDEAKTYRDGKWVMFEPTDTSMFQDFIKLLGIKRKPNKK